MGMLVPSVSGSTVPTTYLLVHYYDVHSLHIYLLSNNNIPQWCGISVLICDLLTNKQAIQ